MGPRVPPLARQLAGGGGPGGDAAWREIWGDLARYGEIWRDMARYGELLSPPLPPSLLPPLPRSSSKLSRNSLGTLSELSPQRRAARARGVDAGAAADGASLRLACPRDLGRDGEIWRDPARSGEIGLPALELVGKVDRLDGLPGGGVAIVDYKTGKAPRAYSAATDAQIRRRSFFQLRCYALLLARGAPPLERGSYGEIWRDLGRYGEIWGDLARSGEIWRDLGRSGEIWRASARRGVQTKTRRTLETTRVQLSPLSPLSPEPSRSRGVRTTPHQTVLPDFRLLDVDTR